MVKTKSIRGKSKRTSNRNPKGREGDPVSLSPLSGEEALRNLLQVKPESKQETQKKRPAKKR
jgi:hypothetical protein